MDDREQQHRVGAGANEHVSIGALRGFGAARIEHHDAAAACLDRLQARAHVGRGHQRAVRRERIRAEADEQVAAIDVGHRHEDLVAEHLQRREHVRQLIERRRAVEVLGAERAQRELADRDEAEVVRGGIALIHADRVGAVTCARGAQLVGDEIERFGPAELVPRVAVAAHRALQSIRIVMQIRERGALRADVAAAERIGVVAAHRSDALAVDLDREPAGCLAQRTAREVGRHVRDLSADPRL